MALHNVEQARFNMIEQQIRPWNVASNAVLQAFADIKREDFVPAACKDLAFADLYIPLPGQQVMLAPRQQARLLQDADVKVGDKVLEIGSGSGFSTAVLARLAKRVIGLEINPELAAMARANLQRAGIDNVDLRLADGAFGAATEAPFDVIFLGGSVWEVPLALLKQLRIGGRLVAVVGTEPIMHATTITRLSDTDFEHRQNWDDNIPALQNFPQPPGFRF